MSKKYLLAMAASVLSLNAAFADCGCADKAAVVAEPVTTEVVVVEETADNAETAVVEAQTDDAVIN